MIDRGKEKKEENINERLRRLYELEREKEREKPPGRNTQPLYAFSLAIFRQVPLSAKRFSYKL